MSSLIAERRCLGCRSGGITKRQVEGTIVYGKNEILYDFFCVNLKISRCR